MANRILYSLIGAFFGLEIPLHWLMWRAYFSRPAWWNAWIKTEFHHLDNVYAFVTILAVSFFALVGYLIGKRNDELEEQSKNVQDDNVALSQLASTDGLTGLFNARSIHERLDLELENSYRSPLTCLLVDIDHFKKINDTCGHPFGDVVLAQVAKILKRSTRNVDAVGRLGGEEFIVVLPNTVQSKALIVAERIRSAIQAEIFEFEEKKIPVTVSLGVVTYPSEELKNKEDLFKAADEALYSAKHAGRNRVLIWEKKESV